MSSRQSVAGLLTVLLVALSSGCLVGTWTDVSPAVAYQTESGQCKQKLGDEARQCQSLVDKKYGRYLQEGGYPSGNTPGSNKEHD